MLLSSRAARAMSPACWPRFVRTWARTAAGPPADRSAAGAFDSRTKTRTLPWTAARLRATLPRSATFRSWSGVVSRSAAIERGKVDCGRIGGWAFTAPGAMAAMSRSDALSAATDRRIMILPWRYSSVRSRSSRAARDRPTRLRRSGIRGDGCKLPRDPPGATVPGSGGRVNYDDGKVAEPLPARTHRSTVRPAASRAR